MWQFFKHLDISLALTLFEPFSTQITISFKPHHFQAKSLQSLLKVCVSNTICHLLFSDYADSMLRVLKNGDFRKFGWVSKFCEIFFNSLIGLSSIWCLCICVGPLWQFELVLRHVSSCSCIFFIVFINCCMLCVWQNVQVTFFGCIELKWVSLLEFSLIELVSHALDVFNLLCSQMPCLAHTVHTLGISRHTSCTSKCTH